MTDAVAGETAIPVAGILYKGNTLFLEIRKNLVAGKRQEGTDEPPGAQAHGSQTGGTGAPQHAVEQGLGLIVPMVTESDEVAPEFVGGADKKRAAQFPGRLFDPLAALTGRCGNVQTLDPQGDIPGRTQLADEVGIAGGFRTDSMIEMGGPQPYPALFGQGSQKAQEGDGIRPAGEPYQNRFPSGQQTLLPQHLEKPSLHSSGS
jgi:hypothetical protein